MLTSAAAFSEEISAAKTLNAAISMRDIDGNNLSTVNSKKLGTVFYFSDTTCPVSNAYIPKLNELSKTYGEHFQFVVINADPQINLPKLNRYVNSYKIIAPVVKDFDGSITKNLGATVSSEVVVVINDVQIVYRGRVDDQFNVGSKQAQAKTNELQEKLEEILKAKKSLLAHAVKSVGLNKDIPFTTTSVSGCSLNLPAESKKSDYIYEKDIHPLLVKHCIGCHQPNTTAPFSMLEFSEVKKWGPVMKYALGVHFMPPHHSDTDPKSYKNSHHLPNDERQKIIDWIGAGMKSNGKKLAKPKVTEGFWKFGKPDFIITLPKPFTVPAQGQGLFHEISVSLGNKKDLWIEKVEFKPGVARVVHHATLYIGNAVNEDVKEISDNRWGYFASYVPGLDRMNFGPKYAKRLPTGQNLILNIHYTPYGKIENDETQVGIYFSKNPKPVEINTDSVRSLDFKIPPQERFYEVNATQVLKENISLLSVVPHAHFRGRSFLMTAKLPSGEKKEIVSVPDFQINWQRSYDFNKPLVLPKNTTLECSVIFDNSDRNTYNPDPSKTVIWGQQSYDEMHFCYYDYLVNKK